MNGKRKGECTVVEAEENRREGEKSVRNGKSILKGIEWAGPGPGKSEGGGGDEAKGREVIADEDG